MFEPIFSGVLFGLLLVILIGPVFFALLQTSLEKGFKPAFFLAVGVLLSDGIYITAAYFGIHSFFENENFKHWVGIAGGFLLIAFGISSILKKSKNFHLEEIKNYSLRKSMLKGFLLNTMNPFVFFFWLGAVGMVSVKENYSEANVLTFFSSTLATAFSTDVLKAFVAHRIKNFLTPQLILWLNRISGVALIIFGIRMLVKAI